MPIPTTYKPGWIEPKKRTREVAEQFEILKSQQPVFGSVSKPIQNTGRGQVVLLHKVVEQMLGYFPIELQEIGDCVSHGFGGAVDALTCVQIAVRNLPQAWKGHTATEWIYGTSRVIQGRGRLGNDDGSLGAWAQAAVKENGTLLRKQYGDYDLSKYSGDVAKDWGYQGLPEHLEATADEHPVQTTALVESYEEIRDAICNGYPVPICSTQGFSDRRDEMGFAKPKGKWPHCMYLIAIDDTGERPGALCINSWGEHWISGPKRHGQPEGSFWIDADTIDKIARQGDSWALSNFKGYVNNVDLYLPFSVTT